MLLETIFRFLLKRLQKDCQWLFVNILFADSLRFVFKNQKQKVYEQLVSTRPDKFLTPPKKCQSLQKK